VVTITVAILVLVGVGVGVSKKKLMCLEAEKFYGGQQLRLVCHRGSQQNASKLCLLQNLPSEKVLVHKKLDKQEWGVIGTILWRYEQKYITDVFRADGGSHDQADAEWIVIRTQLR
jgi:hypothetical protein